MNSQLKQEGTVTSTKDMPAHFGGKNVEAIVPISPMSDPRRDTIGNALGNFSLEGGNASVRVVLVLMSQMVFEMQDDLAQIKAQLAKGK